MKYKTVTERRPDAPHLHHRSRRVAALPTRVLGAIAYRGTLGETAGVVHLYDVGRGDPGEYRETRKIIECGENAR
jgi:hypothetical protein